MSSGSKIGSFDRRVSQPMQSICVIDSYNRIYREAECTELNDQERERIEKQAYKNALKNLGKDDRYCISGTVAMIKNDRHLRNVGEAYAMELLAKLGVWLGKIPEKEFEKLL